MATFTMNIEAEVTDNLSFISLGRVDDCLDTVAVTNIPVFYVNSSLSVGDIVYIDSSFNTTFNGLEYWYRLNNSTETSNVNLNNTVQSVNIFKVSSNGEVLSIGCQS